MYTFVVVLIVIVAILLILVVVVQDSKNGGLAPGLAPAKQIMGVRKVMDFFEKVTWWLAGSFIVLCIIASVFVLRHNRRLEDSIIKENIMETVPRQQEQNENTPPIVNKE